MEFLVVRAAHERLAGLGRHLHGLLRQAVKQLATGGGGSPDHGSLHEPMEVRGRAIGNARQPDAANALKLQKRLRIAR